MAIFRHPTPVAERASEAFQALLRHPERTLLPWYRYALYVELAASHAHGHRARAWLDILAARKVLFCWRPLAAAPRHPVRSHPDALLALAEDTLHDPAECSTAYAALRYARAYCDVAGEPVGSPHYPAWCVYEAAARALESACAGPGQPGGSANALDDAAGYAAVAMAGDGQGEAAEAARLRRAFFWEWWLREAIPAAVARADR